MRSLANFKGMFGIKFTNLFFVFKLFLPVFTDFHMITLMVVELTFAKLRQRLASILAVAKFWMPHGGEQIFIRYLINPVEMFTHNSETFYLIFLTVLLIN